MNHPNIGKLKNGDGGKFCPCCTKLPHNERKVMERRILRHKAKMDLKNIDI